MASTEPIPGTMPKRRALFLSQEAVWLLIGILLIGLFFSEVLWADRVYYSGDSARQYLPQRVTLAQSLREGALPWWAPELGAGYPMLAEGEIGALYPPNWALYAFMPVGRAYVWSIIGHYVLAAAGFYVLLRCAHGLTPGSALFGALTFSLGGFCIARLSHIAILSVAAWFPWLFAFTHSLLGASTLSRRRLGASALGLALAMALQFLAGHPQMSLLGLISLLGYALWLAMAAPWRHRLAWQRVSLWGLALAVGTLIGAAQWLPTAELGALSQRAGGLSADLFVSFSFHPFLTATLASPFALGNPYPQGSVELMVYAGLLPLLLAGLALWRVRGSGKWFWVALGGVGLLLAFGRWNPLYGWLQRVPVLNQFRAPARYLCWTSMALAALAALGIEKWSAGPRLKAGTWVALAGALYLAALTAVLIATLRAQDVDGLIAAWRWFPLALLAASASLLWLARRVPRPIWISLALVLLMVDLYAYAAVLNRTYNISTPSAEAFAEPESLAFLKGDAGLYRVYTREEIVPAVAVQKESLYPNYALYHGISSANIYMPLVPRAYGEYLADLDAERLNRLNVRYYLIPQLLPVDEASELYDVHNPLAALPVRTWLDVPARTVVSIEIESYVSHAAAQPDGVLAAQLLLRSTSGETRRLPVRIGLETAEWAYEREDVAANVAHSKAKVATTWPAISGFPPGEHVGHTYVARYELGEPFQLAAVQWLPERSEAFVRVERVRLYAPSGEGELLAHLVGLGDHTIVHRSADVLIYRNEDALPRAYLLPEALAMVQDGALLLPPRLRPEDVGGVSIERYESMEVTLYAEAHEPTWLVLADLCYPGWEASVDGQRAPILCADGVFRAVRLESGAHRVEFRYRPPLSWRRLKSLVVR